jgi:hypothetical protein
VLHSPSASAPTTEQNKPNTHRIPIFDEALVVPAQAGEEEDAGHVLEAVDPLAALALLAADVDDGELALAEREARLGDARRARADVHRVLVRRPVSRREERVELAEKVAEAVIKESRWRQRPIVSGFRGMRPTFRAARPRSRARRRPARRGRPTARAAPRGTPPGTARRP